MWGYVAEDDASAADAMLDRVFEVTRKLAEWPEMGRERPELMESLRSFAVGSHLIYYRIRGGQLEILRVLHGRRDVDALF